MAGCADFSVKVINTSSFSTVSLEGHSAPVLSVDLDSAGTTAVSSGCDGSVRVWSVENKKQVQCVEGCHPKSSDVPLSPSVAGARFSRDGARLALAKCDTLLVLEREQGWDPARARRVSVGGGQGELITCLDWAADARYILAATNRVRQKYAELHNIGIKLV